MQGAELIYSYFPGLSEQQKQQFPALGPLYTEWNARINVISRKDIEHLFERHVLHSLGIAKVIQFKPGTRVLDIGTGGGFPGIPLAILFPESNFHLVDSIGKKIKVVNEIINALGLKNVTAQQIRAEELKEKYDFVVSRAVTGLNTLFNWVSKNINRKGVHALPNGILALKGGDIEAEIKPFGKRAVVYEMSDFFKEDFFETKKIVFV